MHITEERVMEALNKIQFKEREKPFTEKVLKARRQNRNA
jgi:hypothetical protein